MRRILQHNLFYPAILLFLCLIICFQNYTPNTFLTGWDTLHPEFNFSTNFSRLISGVWRSDQGLGTITAHSHMADLPRVIILYILHFILPLSALRYSYVFLCLIVGTISSFYLIKQIFHKKELAFIGALFYLFNLSTLQQFIVPFEMFCTQFAFLPLILLYSIKYLESHHKKDLIIFSIITLFSTPQAYAAHLWYAFFIIYSLFLLIKLLLNNNLIKKIILLFSLTLLLNSFWLLPNLYYIFSSSSDAKEYKYNRIHSQEFLLKNRETGNPLDTSIQKGFYFNWEIFNFTDKNSQNLLPEWNYFITTIEYKTITYSIFLLSLFGLFITFYKKDKNFYPYAVFFIIPFVFLNNKFPPFSFLFDFLIKNSTLQEAFRFIFNKLTTSYQIGILIYFIYSLDYIFTHKFKFNKKIFILISFLIIFTGLPFFQGQLIHSSLRVSIPQKYFDLYEFLNKEQTGRVLTLPLHQNTGWQYYNWQYQGSGFIWFGSPNSFLDRDSDRWNKYNDNTYQEISNAIYSNDYDKFLDSTNKYQIDYIIWDKDNISTSNKNPDQITFKNEINNLTNTLINNNLIQKVYEIDNLIVFKTINHPQVYSQDINTNIIPKSDYLNTDTAYNYFSEYISDDSKDSLFYPFRNIVDRKTNQINQKILPINFINNIWEINFSNLKNENFQTILPDIQQSESEILANISIKIEKNDINIFFDLSLPEEIKKQINQNFIITNNTTDYLLINNHQLAIDINNPFIQNLGSLPIFTKEINSINNQNIYFGFEQIINTKNLSKINFSGINFYPQDIKNYADQIKINNKQILLSSKNTTNGFSLPLKNLPHSSNYILAIKSQHIKGIPARFCLKNYYSNQCSFEEEISNSKTEQWNYYLVPKLDADIDYDLHINSISQGNYSSESSISQISIIPFPYQYLSKIYYSPSNYQYKRNSLKNILDYKTIGNFFYKINFSKTNSQLIISQSFNKDWIAFYFDNKQIKFLDHVLVNNWANGWNTDTLNSISNPTIYIIFWPQILEILGFIIIPIVFIFLSIDKKSHFKERN